MSDQEPSPVVVVRVRTSIWSDRTGIHQKRTITYLRRKSHGFNFLEEEVSMTGADLALAHVINFDKVEDGVYRVVTCNEQKDWETGYVDSYDFELLPYEPTHSPH